VRTGSQHSSLAPHLYMSSNLQFTEDPQAEDLQGLDELHPDYSGGILPLPTTII